MEHRITLLELLELIVLFSLSVAFIGRIIRFFYLRYSSKLIIPKVILVLINAQIISWILTALFWKFWSFERDVMLGYFCIPTIIGEFIILSATFICLRGNHGLNFFNRFYG